MTSIGQVFYKEEFGIQEIIENAYGLGETIESIALPIIESVGKMALAAIQVGAMVVFGVVASTGVIAFTVTALVLMALRVLDFVEIVDPKVAKLPISNSVSNEDKLEEKPNPSDIEEEESNVIVPSIKIEDVEVLVEFESNRVNLEAAVYAGDIY